MFDQITGPESNLGQVCQDWCTNWMGKEGVNYNADGELVSVVGYYDPELDHKQYFGSKERGAGMGLGIAWYLLPQGGVAADLAVAMYKAAVREIGWADPSTPIEQMLSPGVRQMCLGVALAKAWRAALSLSAWL